MKRLLLIHAHPAPRKSRVNQALAAAVRGMEGLTFHDLYETYPDFFVNVRREQELLSQHDVVIFQHPFYWYSTPALIKQWLDLVLEHGFAYGEQGRALEGKPWLHAITTAGGPEAYCAEGSNRFTIRQLLAPLEQTAHLCRAVFLPPFVVQSTFKITPGELQRHAADFRQVLEHLRDGRLDTLDLASLDHLNAALPRPADAP